MSVIFLDFDGVLNCVGRVDCFEDWQYDNHPQFYQPAIDSLNAVLDAVPDARIVVSSTWRYMFGMRELRHLMLANEIDVGEHAERVIGATPQLDGPRGDEIQAWLDARGECVSEDDRIVILDDNPDMVHLKSRLVQTDPSIGLTTADADLAIDMLMGVA